MGLSSGEVAEEVTGGSGPGAERALEANNQSPRAKREVRSSPELPCERRPRPAEPRRGTYPQRQPQHSATAKQVRAPGCMRRSFRTLRLCARPGVSPRAGIRCPVEALIPSASPGTRPPQNRCEPPGACGVPSERTGCVPYPGFHPGLVCGAPLGHSERLNSPGHPAPESVGNATSPVHKTPTKKPTRESPKSGPNTKSAPSGSGTGPERA